LRFGEERRYASRFETTLGDWTRIPFDILGTTNIGKPLPHVIRKPPSMNVFILCTGRCGSTTFIRACEHITNFTAAHESRAGHIGKQRLAYPSNHIEADNRLSWFLGRLENRYGDRAHYVHLTRDPTDVARSYARRWDVGIMRAYHDGVLWQMDPANVREDVAMDYCQTVLANTDQFLANKSNVMSMQLENAQDQFTEFWQWIGAEGDLQAALAEWDSKTNSSENPARRVIPSPAELRRLRNEELANAGVAKRATYKLGRILAGLPAYVRRA